MPLGGYPHLNSFSRAARVLAVVAVAASVGGLIGGFAIYALDRALTRLVLLQSPDDNLPPTADQQPNQPVAFGGGGVPDPYAGLSGPVAAQQAGASQSASTPAQVSPQVLAAKPLGPSAQLQPLHETAAQPPPTPTPAAAISGAQEIMPPKPNAPPAPAAITNWQARDQNVVPDRAATADQQDRAASSRGYRERKRRAITSNVPWSVEGDSAVPSGRTTRRFDAPAYDQLYDSYGNPRVQGDPSRAWRRLPPDARYRSRVIGRELPDEARPRGGPFRGGGSFGGDRFGGFRDQGD